MLSLAIAGLFASVRAQTMSCSSMPIFDLMAGSLTSFTLPEMPICSSATLTWNDSSIEDFQLSKNSSCRLVDGNAQTLDLRLSTAIVPGETRLVFYCEEVSFCMTINVTESDISSYSKTSIEMQCPSAGNMPNSTLSTFNGTSRPLTAPLSDSSIDPTDDTNNNATGPAGISLPLTASEPAGMESAQQTSSAGTPSIWGFPSLFTNPAASSVSTTPFVSTQGIPAAFDPSDTNIPSAISQAQSLSAASLSSASGLTSSSLTQTMPTTLSTSLFNAMSPDYMSTPSTSSSAQSAGGWTCSSS